MGFTTYREIIRKRVVIRILAISLLIRVPMWAAGIVLMLHVVTTLHHNYAAAGLVEMVYSLALSISSPWRGRLLDRIGLRATVGPSLVAMTIAWSIAPWVGFWPLVTLVAVGGLFMVPSFSIVRQVLIGAVPERQRTAALSLDSVFTEITFMIGPVLGVFAATYLDTRLALLICQLAVVVGGIVLCLDNPSLGAEAAEGEGSPTGRSTRAMLSPVVLMVLAVSVAATVILTAEDLGTVAALRAMDSTTSIGWVLALWGAGSAVGGIVYGALHRPPSSAVLLVCLATTTAAVAMAPNKPLFIVLLTLSGLFCAPTITATVADLTRAVPAWVRGEAMGWHGSALTLGGAAAAPVVGWLLDAGGWARGFSVIGGAGAVIAVLGLALRQRHEHGSHGSVDLQGSEDLASGLAAIEGVEVQPGSAALQ